VVSAAGDGTFRHARREEIHKVSDSLCNEHRGCRRLPIDISLQHCDRRDSFSSLPLFDCSGRFVCRKWGGCDGLQVVRIMISTVMDTTGNPYVIIV